MTEQQPSTHHFLFLFAQSLLRHLFELTSKRNNKKKNNNVRDRRRSEKSMSKKKVKNPEKSRDRTGPLSPIHNRADSGFFDQRLDRLGDLGDFRHKRRFLHTNQQKRDQESEFYHQRALCFGLGSVKEPFASAP